nr:MAG TPA: RecT protein [Caudoviricetes sp.]
MKEATTQVVGTANGSVPAKAPRPVDVLNRIIADDSTQAQFKNALGKASGSFLSSVVELFTGDANLQRCQPKLILAEALKAATLHLPISKALGFAFVVPYKKRSKVSVQQADGSYREEWTDVYIPTFQIGYKGLIQLAMRTGQYRTINADVVYEGELRKGSKLTGIYDFEGEKKSDKVIGYFCYFELLNGFSKTLYMTIEQMAAHAKQYSKALVGRDVTVESLLKNASLPVSPDSKTVGWLGNFHGMAIKTTIRNLLSKYGYLSVEMQKAIDYETESDEKAIEIGGDRQLQAHANISDANVIDIETASFEEVSSTSQEAKVEPKEEEAPY